MTLKIFRSILTAALVVLLSVLLFVTYVLHDYFGSIQEDELRDELELASVSVEEMGIEYLKKLRSNRYRITWVDTDGTVLYDTHADTVAEVMENHADREEIREALANGSGSSFRYSATLTEKTIYETVKLTDGTVLRISVSYSTAGALLLGLSQSMTIIAVLAAVLSGFLANRMAKRIVEPLNRLDLEHPLENNAYDELAPLLNRIHAQQREINRQMHVLQQKNDEFHQITGCMQEGLVLLDAKGAVLCINPAARKLFQTGKACIGEDFLTVDRQHDICEAIESAMKTGHSELRAARNGREYQFDVSRIESKGNVHGAVILAFDITEQMDAEKNRREFTANVSHELKTPLQCIIGSADLLENGLVKEEDIPRFAGHIRKEAARLVSLIEDIIRLSQLDEGGELPMEDVDLRQLTEEVVTTLTGAAQTMNIALFAEGEGRINGVRRLLYEIIYNLCDNGIKYNKEGGSVTVTLAEKSSEMVITVKDTGVGIPAEYQNRVFERFYRVDKSHSKTSGGTGLGLSIVKHAVQVHHGKISLKSEVERGTEITVVLPK